MSDPKFVRIPLTEALELASFLEQLTISLDLIGSREGGGMDGARMLRNFIEDSNTFQRANRLRFVVWDASEEILGEVEVHRIAEALPVFPQVGGRDYH